MPTTLITRTRAAVAVLTPGYFALVMASGILSTGTHLQGHRILSVILLGICVTSFVTLLALNVWRLLAYRRAVAEDFVRPDRAFGFFTFVAGTNVLGVRLGLDGHHQATAWLLVAAGSLWLVLGYVVPWTAVLGPQTRPVVATANGTWFIWVVASQSVAVAAADLEPVVGVGRNVLGLVAVTSWSIGIFLYVAAGVFVSMRLMNYPFGPEDFTPPYWVAMGAVAITVVAGANITDMADAPMVAATRGLVSGLSVVFWAFATWLFPVLVAAGVWRHAVRKVPLRYEATLWSIVFPLGMYAVAGISLGRADHLPIVALIGRVELWVALTAFALTLVAMGGHVTRTVLAPARAS